MAMELLYYLGLGLVGGVILNVMPCVLPVLTMKVFHLVERGTGTSRSRHLHGLAYAGGVLAAFLALAIGLVLLRASGEQVGWGMQFQHPAFVATMVALIFTFGLNALGVFEWTLSLSGRPGHEGYAGSFGNGVFAAVMSTPCSAPFLGTAAAFALGTGAVWWQTVTLFLSIGLGLASPFLLVSFVPSLGRRLPRPGPWMETFKHLMGFSLLATAVWLFGVLQAQVARSASTLFLAFLLVLAVALWAIHRFGGVIHGTARRLAVRGVSACIVVGAGFAFIDFAPAERAGAAVAGDAPIVQGDRIAWRTFDPARITDEHKRNRPVFVDFTAEWCANCKTNERVFIETEAVRKVLVASDIVPMKADFTNEDEQIWKWLQALGRTGVPAYVIYLPDGTRDLLPEQITTAMLVERLTAAARKASGGAAGKRGRLPAPGASGETASSDDAPRAEPATL